MRVISVPIRLRFAVSLLLLSVPIAAIEAVVISRAPWWRLPYHSMAVWCISALLISMPIMFSLIAGGKGAFRVATVASALWCLFSGLAAIRMNHPALGFFTIFLIWFYGGLLVWIRHEISRSYFDPQILWYHGLPKPIPGLKCFLVHGGNEGNEQKNEFKVSRLDQEGAFLFKERGSESQPALKSGEKFDLSFSFRDKQVKCSAIPRRSLGREGHGVGAGYQFSGLSPDIKKELSDFVETLRGEGYV